MTRSTIELRIESLAAGGDGVAHEPGGRVVFVPLTAPGDLVRVRLLTVRKRFARGEVIDVLEPGPARISPRCSVFGRCGGCAWQHVDYPAQLDAKAKIVGDALRRIARLDVAESVPITASPAAYGYRSRARLLQEGDSLGYRMRRSHQLCAVTECPILQPELEAVLRMPRPAAEDGEALEWEIAVGSGGAPRAGPAEERPEPGVAAVEQQVGGDRLRISHGVFAQGNALLLGPLVDAVVREAAAGPGRTSVLELYAGAGLFTLGLARHFDWVTAVESHPGAVADLRFNLGRAGAENVDVRLDSVEEVLPSLELASPEVVVLDPPRTGVEPEALAEIQRLRANRIVYLSCDAATLARDLGELRNDGYQVKHVEAFDLFPQTPHVETLVALELP